MAGLSVKFEFNSKGLLVTGETFKLKDLLKSKGGRWDAFLKGWVFPFESKQDLSEALKACPEAKGLRIEDHAKVELVAGAGPADSDGSSILVTGDTFPVKALLREVGGTWNPSLKGWTFKRAELKDLAKALRKSPDVGKVEVQSQSQSSGAIVVASGKTEKSQSKLRLPATPQKKQGATSGAISKKAGSVKVTESASSTQKSEKRADGTSAKSKVDKTQRKVSCKRTGSHLQTESVTKKRKVVEKNNKIVETRTITVKRIRNKT
eukprot:TRINITY_DN112674_c0_g1_i1.p1 TRINITY_DN112674_c0_g1~~TRINITY_DN112674_c0_g1_i1.p1  ORF type:complete len:295 (+),score=56.31 TRINITY_DN112674_c0_g1_i1:95-886(+)